MLRLKTHMLDDLIKQQLDNLKYKGLLRQRMVKYARIDFSKNDYLSLSNNANLKKAYQNGYEIYNCGSSGSAVICGYNAIHEELEQTFAKMLNVDMALLFTSGYAANLAVVSLLQSLDAYLLIDKGIHASIYDGIKLTKVKYKRYLHNDLDNLSKITQSIAIKTNLVIITESIFSMSGNIAPLEQIIKFNIPTIVDEAHAFGVFGKHGLGLIDHFALNQHNIPLRTISFGKALSAQGAIVAGKKNWIMALLQNARSYIYSTAMSPALAYGILHALQLLYAADDKRIYLQELIVYFRQCCINSDLCWADSYSPIQQLQIGCPHIAQKLTHYLLSQGINCQAIRQPTVTLQATGLRIVLNCHHNQDDIDFLFNKLKQFYAHTS